MARPAIIVSLMGLLLLPVSSWSEEPPSLAFLEFLGEDEIDNEELDNIKIVKQDSHTQQVTAGNERASSDMGDKQ
ncbi:MAG: hypothetical protein COB89_01750 [Piscirickettsiaceae bacterium]|nr:MAG: hypothetical protein COB89_01750 [Piscirickettsiaceae bacterium]